MNDPIECETCGETAGSFMETATGWACLKHLPKLGRRANRDRKVA